MGQDPRIRELWRLIGDGDRRKIQKYGNSGSVNIPADLLAEHNLGAGDEVLILPSDEEGKICEIYEKPSDV